MPLTKEEKTEIVGQFGKDGNDSGSAEVQIALFTKRIRQLTEHAKVHKKDHHTKRGLVQLVSQRKKMLKYLVKTNPDSYVKTIKDLGIRG
ncbi:MAG: 30S ribosomal protein S15 [Candidatus Marinimicrobia bacterium]|jgi:small subunit ribosomal protein S15|nr:30S ribosomal protein S15 [Candidatus Neomarinimicrobiota bacterium]MBT3496594.1 30S ribosomal protein S15 [Candidatus Neomarinimicrobiota bacterium]MBT3692271.1 30S ribosomal protein S15 [Candidatus Neomarinimicrobiota bacterium]MBT3732946.1 30S ribosomal protein S15 [Candidatus Neomarinimicrobiota bacterium]MBT4145003.1 30S ribosomal protein S15 [Candidatus Neomarinimicrobiota bacterium]